MRMQVYASSGSASPDGRPGQYQALFIFTTPGVQTFLADVDLDQIVNAGDTQLVFPSPAYLRVTPDDGQKSTVVYLIPNKENRLARAEVSVHASSMDNARRYTYELVSYILSSLSYQYDVSLDILGYQIAEEATGVHYWSFNVLGHVKHMDVSPAIHLRQEHSSVLAAYREAVNATNPFYQFLCFYRAIEGVRKIRDHKRTTAVENGEEYKQPNERIPGTIEELPEEHRRSTSIFAPYLGKKFTYVIEESFRNDVRNAVAHLDPTKNHLMVDRYTDVERVEQIMRVMRYMCREMLKNELSFPSPGSKEETIN